jgi:hypothetical protein
MSDASHITTLNQARTLVASRFVPRFNIPITEYKVASPFPNGFVIQQLNSNKVNVFIDGNVHVSQNMIVDGGIEPIYLRLRPLTTTTPPYDQTGTLWIKEDASQQIPSYSLMMDGNEILNTSPNKDGAFGNIAMNTAYSLTNQINISTNLIPSIDGYDGVAGFNLGSEDYFWSTLFVRDMVIAPNTIRVVGDNNTEMRICYDTTTGKSIVKTGEYEVETVTTSKMIPGQIDASFLPFSGLTFASKLNIETYITNVSNTLLDQLLRTIYTLNKEVVDGPVHDPGELVECDTGKLIKNITGHYYVVITNTGKKVTISLPKVIANTNLISETNSAILVTSPFTFLSEDVVEVSDGDIIIFYHNYVPNPHQTGTFDIIFGFQNINFRLPINSVANINILNNTITSSKLENNTITNAKLSSGSINVRTLSNDVLELIATSSGNNAEISTAIGQLQTKINRLEKYITLMSCTYFITDTTTGENVTYDTIDQVVF